MAPAQVDEWPRAIGFGLLVNQKLRHDVRAYTLHSANQKRPDCATRHLTFEFDR
jgi:hypothetical protein